MIFSDPVLGGYKEVSKEEFISFLANYKNRGNLERRFCMGWLDIYDSEVGGARSIAISTPDNKYYILKEMFKDEKL